VGGGRGGVFGGWGAFVEMTPLKSWSRALPLLLVVLLVVVVVLVVVVLLLSCFLIQLTCTGLHTVSFEGD